jgi:predicted AAA+ superfamily ATPase
MSERPVLFPQFELPDEVVATLRMQNPWWEGKPGKPLPSTRRHLVAQIKRRLASRLAPIVAVRGPRQIGKTTAQLHVIEDLLASGMSARRILRVQFDDLESLRRIKEPLPRVVEWFEGSVLGRTLNEASHAGQPAMIFFDEVQNLRHWAEQLKSLVDHVGVQVVVTGSSALRIESGRESLAGRVHTIEAGVLSLTEIARFRSLPLGEPFLPDNGLEPLADQGFWLALRAHGEKHRAARDAAFAAFSQRGGYPLMHERPDQLWPQLADQLNETVIRRVIKHDLRVGDRGRKRDESMLEELFRLACRYAGQAPHRTTLAREVQRALGANVGPARIDAYMKFLNDALLIRVIPPFEIRLKRTKGSPKLCLADHALRASWLQEVVPLDPQGLDANMHLADIAGHLAESIAGASLSTIAGLDLACLPARSDRQEVDFVLTVGVKRIPLEVKYRRRIDPLADTEGLRTFLETRANNAPFAILVTMQDEPHDARRVTDPRIVALPLSTLLLLR